MSDSDNQEEGDNPATRYILLGGQHGHPPIHDGVNDQIDNCFPKEPVRIDKEVMGDFDSNPALLTNRNLIHPPLSEGRSYEILPEVIALVNKNQFQGRPQENPLEQIDAFEEICGTISADGAPKEYLKCKLFSFTLTGKALKMGEVSFSSIHNYLERVQRGILRHFFTKQRAYLLREKISNFQQGPVEPFHEALESFKNYTRECPNHGLSYGNL
ncbi:unnamed protein product [Microthlaspi erraticum]|uniref:Retrotransposon gag domain-containing protein n=1 Tax=Microthlaspi erraticum TaxID=1685480 RepID=A0A6D2IKS2_9BRAS|nr:unnamed protein product [Microthlaspi erraticum]